MKNFKSVLAIALVAFAMVSCTKLEKVLPKADGVWKATSQTNVSFENGVETARETTPSNQLPTFTFRDDNTGTASLPGEPDEAFTWSANSDNDKLTITQVSFPVAFTFDVLELSSKSQTWFYTYEDGNEREETTIELERQ